MQRLIYVPSATLGNYPQFLFVGEAPGYWEEERRQPFVGRSGEWLRDRLSSYAIEAYTLTNIVKVRPDNNRTPTHEEIMSWIPSLVEDVLTFYTRCDIKAKTNIVALGKTAEVALTELKNRGVITEFYSIPHPAAAMRFPHHREVFDDGLSKLSMERWS